MAGKSAWAALLVAGGMAAGFGLATALQSSRVEAAAASGAVEGCLLTTGRGSNTSVDNLWSLDEKGILTCWVFNANGVPAVTPQLNMTEIFGKRGSAAKKSKFAMVSGKFEAGTQTSDVIYIMDSNTNRVALVAFTQRGGLQVIWHGTYSPETRPGKPAP